jgi:hypothetical protein
VQESCGTLTLTDRDPILVEKVLEYLYTANYTLISGILRHTTAIIQSSVSVESIIYSYFE